ncbi:MAG: Lrp/AsnC family transcriptional regulator [Martelella sp.]
MVPDTGLRGNVAARLERAATPARARAIAVAAIRETFEETGLIARKVAIVDRRKANVGMTVFVAVRTSRHSMDWLESFRRAISDIPEIVEAYRLTGDMDYLLRLVVPDVEVYDAVYKQLIARLDFTDISSFIGMEELKYTTAVPMNYL